MGWSAQAETGAGEFSGWFESVYGVGGFSLAVLSSVKE
jgi:hypothetical protein